jgi:hypothetical protein
MNKRERERVRRAAFVQLANIEPQLSELLAEAKRIRKAASGKLTACANWPWYREHGLRSRLINLVGWEAANPGIRDCESYDVAYHHIYHHLPNCRNCFCWGIERDADELAQARATDARCNGLADGGGIP